MTFSAQLDPIIDAALAMVSLPTGWTKSSVATAPASYEPNTLYCWGRQEPRAVAMDGGSHEELWFFLTMAVAKGTDEARGHTRLRATSDSIDADGLAAIDTAVRQNRTSAVWEWIQIDRLEPNAAIAFQERVGWASLSGYRYV